MLNLARPVFFKKAVDITSPVGGLPLDTSRSLDHSPTALLSRGMDCLPVQTHSLPQTPPQPLNLRTKNIIAETVC